MPAHLRVLAHAGAGADWQALLTAITIGLLVVFLLALTRRITIDSFDDLVVPLAAIAVLSGIAGPMASGLLSDLVGYVVPAGAVVLLALLLAAGSDLELRWSSPLALAAASVAAISAILLGPRLSLAWHPPETTGDTMDGAALVAALCDAQQADSPDEARRVFNSRAHGPLHDLARRVVEVDRTVASQLHEAKYRVESAVTGDENEQLAERLESLTDITRTSLTLLGQQAPPCDRNDG